MTFATLILKNLVRQRVRTALTVLGISLGITTVVALGVITNGLKATSAQIINFGGADFMVAQEGASDLTFSSVPEGDVTEVAAEPGVARTEGVLLHIIRVGSNPYFFVFGRDPAAMVENPPELISGRLISPGAANEVLLGTRAAAMLEDPAIGQAVVIDDRELTVVGIYRTDSYWEEGGAYIPLTTVQQMASKPGVVTAIFVTVAEGSDPDAVARQIEQQFTHLVTISNVSEYGKVDQGMNILDAVNLAISVLAVGIGAIGVMNTMVMSVFERTREIGILRAVGWSGRRIFRMIMTESLLLCLVAAVFGTLLALAAVQGVMQIETVKSFLQPQYSPGVFLRALIVAVGVATFGALYPAMRAVRLTPLEAIRYE